MKVSFNLNKSKVDSFLRKHPRATAIELSNTVELVGFKLEREAKVEAPVITGNLRRQIGFKKKGEFSGIVKAGANYSSFVHGNPYHSSARMRKTTPFFTNALGNTENFIDRQMSSIFSRILKTSLK